MAVAISAAQAMNGVHLHPWIVLLARFRVKWSCIIFCSLAPGLLSITNITLPRSSDILLDTQLGCREGFLPHVTHPGYWSHNKTTMRSARQRRPEIKDNWHNVRWDQAWRPRIGLAPSDRPWRPRIGLAVGLEIGGTNLLYLQWLRFLWCVNVDSDGRCQGN